MIVVARKYRLIERLNNKFVINEHRKEIRSSVKIEKYILDEYNANAEMSGILYEVDEKATEERNNSINGVEKQMVDRDALKQEADDLGLDYQKNIKTPVLIELIENAKRN